MRNGGKWTRWGRGSCEGYSLEMGVRDLNGQVVRNMKPPDTWRASIGAGGDRHFATCDEAMAYVEGELRAAMREILVNWNAYQAQRSLSRIGVR
jgi:hypothetical protein